MPQSTRTIANTIAAGPPGGSSGREPSVPELARVCSRVIQERPRGVDTSSYEHARATRHTDGVRAQAADRRARAAPRPADGPAPRRAVDRQEPDAEPGARRARARARRRDAARVRGQRLVLGSPPRRDPRHLRVQAPGGPPRRGARAASSTSPACPSCTRCCAPDGGASSSLLDGPGTSRHRSPT